MDNRKLSSSISSIKSGDDFSNLCDHLSADDKSYLLDKSWHYNIKKPFIVKLISLAIITGILLFTLFYEEQGIIVMINKYVMLLAYLVTYVVAHVYISDWNISKNIYCKLIAK